MQKYVINTVEEFNDYSNKFKVAKACYNLSAFLELFQVKLKSDDKYESLTEFQGIYFIGGKDLSIFLKKMVTLGFVNPNAIKTFLSGTNRIYSHSMNIEVDKLILGRLKDKQYLDSLVKDGVPIHRVIVPRIILSNKPIDVGHTLVKRYVYIWELYIVYMAYKHFVRLSYDIFKDRLLKNVIYEEDIILQAVQHVASIPIDDVVKNEDKYMMVATEKEVDELVSVNYLSREYFIKTADNKLKKGRKRTYVKRDIDNG